MGAPAARYGCLMEFPGHWAHHDPHPSKRGATTLTATCDGAVIDTIDFGELTPDRSRRWFRRVMLEHEPHCTLLQEETA